MITGFNTDVQYEGRVFHVQTEDRGLDNPVVESLVYTGGEIITSRRTAYADLARSSDYSEAEVARRMESQHQALIREILSGRFDPEGPKPFGYNIITNRALDEVVLDFLSREVGLEQIRLELAEQQIFVEGSQPQLSLRVIAEASDRPVAGAKVTVKLISTREKPKELFSGTTAHDGRIEATFEIPSMPGANAAILLQAEASGNNAEIKQLVMKSQAES
ncbi:MAG TPA: hypothetical protein VJ826_04405 [Candidatus Polarisedimenticolaceae bacterium]|nr:hypothetical protein [Candidatus Polarisedimenticolaceae bacterium]